MSVALHLESMPRTVTMPMTVRQESVDARTVCRHADGERYVRDGEDEDEVYDEVVCGACGVDLL